ncbi:uncharacterized protein LOC125648357 isoform X2 [Ostrea edulis]|uniref:uncharacterized protein LOC125648357 isoform X2 n=1 Tax=Ostrea edulis TaxID=37623 RepID=UPI00209452EE|nr:uncharacterized protein LOC125648357 isoform X2 [Ostrea edulis]
MNALTTLTVTCFALCLTFCLAARSYNSGRRPRPPQVEPPFPNPSPSPCPFGRQMDQSQLCQSSFFPNTPSQCPRGFFCNTPADGFGYCCLNRSPCPQGNPFQRNGGAVNCDRQRCPGRYVCTRGPGYAVCCRGSTGNSYSRH